VDGSCGLVNASENGKPAKAVGGAVNAAVGATFVIVIVAVSTPVWPTSLLPSPRDRRRA
jgi:hypothetical protein